MAEPPRREPPPDSAPARFPAVDLHVDGRSLHGQRLDAQAAVDAARLQSIGARRALVTASAGVAADAGPARVAADEATSVLRAAVRVLTEIGTLQGEDVSPMLAVDIEIHPDGVTTVVRPHGDLDLLTSPRLEQICLEQLDAEIPLHGLQIDLSAVSFLDSSGLAVLVELQRGCGESDTAFALTGLTAKSRRLLQITRLDTVLNIV